MLANDRLQSRDGFFIVQFSNIALPCGYFIINHFKKPLLFLKLKVVMRAIKTTSHSLLLVLFASLLSDCFSYSQTTYAVGDLGKRLREKDFSSSGIGQTLSELR